MKKEYEAIRKVFIKAIDKNLENTYDRLEYLIKKDGDILKKNSIEDILLISSGLAKPKYIKALNGPGADCIFATPKGKNLYDKVKKL